MTLSQQQELAKKLRKEENFTEALPLFEAIWEAEKNEWNGYYLVQCLRKIENYATAAELHKIFADSYPKSKPIFHERLWLDYTTKVKNWQYENYLIAAEYIIKHSEQHDPYTKNLFIKTILAVARRMHDPVIKLQWLERLDQSLLDNKVFRFNNIAYPADRKKYFIEYADALIQLNNQTDYLERTLSQLYFKGAKHIAFLRYIVNSFTFKDWNGGPFLSRTRLALQIKNFQEEIHLRTRNDLPSKYNEHRKISISDLSHFLFCPVSYAISQTFDVYANSSWERDEWKKDKLYFADRLRIFEETSSLPQSFDDAEIQFDEVMTRQLNYIFQSKVLVNNVTKIEPTIFTSVSGNLTGAPDYIMQHTSGTKYVLMEKFSHISAQDVAAPFESDLVKPLAFLAEFGELGLSFGLLLNWYWDLTDIAKAGEPVKKKIVLRSFKINKVDADSNRGPLERSIELTSKFSRDKMLIMDGDSLSWPNKCLNCSVVSYCHHKTGRV
jgi:tetratricopeptide (TPR) repeat protein